MKATKIFMMAALALTFAACSNNDDNDFAQQPAAQPANGEITITATLDANDGVSTRALSIDGINIASTWETTDQFAILYNNGTENTKSIATVDKIDGTTVTITFTIPASLASNTACTIVYPASAANAANTGADVATALAAQDGTIGNCPEVRVGTATIDKDNHSLSSVTKLAAQNAIFKLTLKNIDATADVSATSVKIYNQANTLLTTVTPASGYDKVMYVALPTTATTLKFAVTDGTTNYFNMASGLSLGTNFYQSTIKLATVGDVIMSTGKCAKAGTAGARAMIAYLGNASDCANGLAIALEDVSSNPLSWNNEGDYNGGKTAAQWCSAWNTSKAVTGGTWHFPSAKDWQYMFIGCGSGESYSDPYMHMTKSYIGLKDKLSAAGGIPLKTEESHCHYWSSTEWLSDAVAWYLTFVDGSHARFFFDMEKLDYDNMLLYYYYVRACLAF